MHKELIEVKKKVEDEQENVRQLWKNATTEAEQYRLAQKINALDETLINLSRAAPPLFEYERSE